MFCSCSGVQFPDNHQEEEDTTLAVPADVSVRKQHRVQHHVKARIHEDSLTKSTPENSHATSNVQTRTTVLVVYLKSMPSSIESKCQSEGVIYDDEVAAILRCPKSQCMPFLLRMSYCADQKREVRYGAFELI